MYTPSLNRISWEMPLTNQTSLSIHSTKMKSSLAGDNSTTLSVISVRPVGVIVPTAVKHGNSRVPSNPAFLHLIPCSITITPVIFTTIVCSLLVQSIGPALYIKVPTEEVAGATESILAEVISNG